MRTLDFLCNIMATTAQNAPLSVSGSTLSNPSTNAYTSVPKFDEKLLYSSEKSVVSTVKTAMNMYDAIIIGAIVFIIGMLVYVVATNNTPTKKKK